jgi:hypothetical protein
VAVQTTFAVSAPLLVLNLLAGAVWVGSLAALAVVTRAAQEVLDPRTRVSFFRAVGRRYGVVGGGALAMAIATGAALLGGEEWSGALTTLVALTAALVLATILGVAQARHVNRLRQSQHADGAVPDGAIARHAVRAHALRAGIALLTLAIVIDVAVYVSG